MDFELSDASHRADSLRFICIFMGANADEIGENMLQFGIKVREKRFNNVMFAEWSR